MNLTAELGPARPRIGFGALMLDLYPKGPLDAQIYDPETDPTEVP